MINSTHSAFDQIRPLRDLCCHLGCFPSSTRPPLQQVFRHRDRASTKPRPRQFSRLWECQPAKEKVLSSSDPEKDFQMSFEQLKNVKLMPVITNERLSQSKVIHGQAARDRPMENLLIVSGYFYYVSEIIEIGQRRSMSSKH